jgi:hypothetical protein
MVKVVARTVRDDVKDAIWMPTGPWEAPIRSLERSSQVATRTRDESCRVSRTQACSTSTAILHRFMPPSTLQVTADLTATAGLCHNLRMATDAIS